MFDPASNMASASIAVGPVNEAAAFIPFVLAKKRYLVAPIQSVHSGRNVYIVGNQQSLAGFKFENEALMPTTVVIVRQQANHPAAAFHLERRSLLADRLVKLGIGWL